MKTKTINLYTFDELSDAAKEKARDWWRELEAQDFGHNDPYYFYDPYQTAAKLLGIEFKTHDVKLMGGGTRTEPDIWWTLHVQGAGASFNATYAYAKGSVKAIKVEFPTATALHAIAEGLAEIQKRYQYGITGVIVSDSRGHFLNLDLDNADVSDAEDEAIRELFRDFARWIYKGIEAEYDDRMSDEYVDDAIKANEYTFTEAGKRESL